MHTNATHTRDSILIFIYILYTHGRRIPCARGPDLTTVGRLYFPLSLSLSRYILYYCFVHLVFSQISGRCTPPLDIFRWVRIRITRWSYQPHLTLPSIAVSFFIFIFKSHKFFSYILYTYVQCCGGYSVGILKITTYYRYMRTIAFKLNLSDNQYVVIIISVIEKRCTYNITPFIFVILEGPHITDVLILHKLLNKKIVLFELLSKINF